MGQTPIYAAELGLSTNLWGRAPIYGAELMLSTDLWGRPPIYGADVEPRPMGQNGAPPPPPPTVGVSQPPLSNTSKLRHRRRGPPAPLCPIAPPHSAAP